MAIFMNFIKTNITIGIS